MLNGHLIWSLEWDNTGKVLQYVAVIGKKTHKFIRESA